MKNKVISLLSIIVAFFMGCLLTYIVMTKQQMDRLLQVKQQYQSSKPSNSTQPVQTNITKQPALADTISQLEQQLSNPQSSDKSNNINVNDYSQAQAKALIDDMPDYVLGQYVDKFMTKDASNAIADKRRFAERAIEEFYGKNDNQPMVGDIKLSLDSDMPSISMDTARMDKNAKVYAHLDTHGKVAGNPYVFIKWVNNQTGQVLLFEKKNVVADSNQNWVSFHPYDGWQTGSYDIRFYQFDSELQPVAQLTYDIYEVVE